jgi:hypothetical protein
MPKTRKAYILGSLLILIAAYASYRWIGYCRPLENPYGGFEGGDHYCARHSILYFREMPYFSEGETFDGDLRKIDGADLETFQFLSRELAKDDRHVYVGYGKVIDDLDPKTTEILRRGSSVEVLSQDDGKVYYKETVLNKAFFRSEEVDSLVPLQREEIFDGGGVIMIKDKDTLYCKRAESVFEKASAVFDPATFRRLDSYYSKDKNVVYLDVCPDVKLAEGVDPQTFVSLGGGYGKDISSFYYKGRKISVEDPVSFRSIGEMLAADRGSIYCQGKKVGKFNGDKNLQSFLKSMEFRVDCPEATR